MLHLLLIVVLSVLIGVFISIATMIAFTIVTDTDIIIEFRSKEEASK